jgi:hypothetical protein
MDPERPDPLDRVPHDDFDQLGHEVIAQALRAVKAFTLARALGEPVTRIDEPTGMGHAIVEEVEEGLFVVDLVLATTPVARAGVERLPENSFGPAPLPGDRCCVVVHVGGMMRRRKSVCG